MSQQLQIVGIPPTLNEVRRMHHYAQASEKKRWEQLVRIESKVQKLQPVSGPVIITYRFHFKDARRRDPDGYAYSAKSIQDGLVKSGILPDDNFTVVRELRIAEGERRKSPGITVEIEEVSA
jgi:Holliday junction resolvase RusA-like endonuclease